MSRIYKYEIPLGEHQSVLMHPGKILHSRIADTIITIWAEAEVPSGQRHRHFQVVGTGGEPPELGVYLSTSIDGPFVWHLYDITGGTA